MNSDLKRIIIAAALAAASVSATAHLPPSQPTLAIHKIDERHPATHAARPSRIRIERCQPKVAVHDERSRSPLSVML